MKIVALLENHSETELEAKHGLSLYIETKKHTLLFDVGPDDTFLANAQKRNIDLTKVDTVILSHGHADHGGGLRAFLEQNQTAKVYIQKSAFEPYYSKSSPENEFIGLDSTLQNHPRIQLLFGNHVIDEELHLFTVSKPGRLQSPMNDSLLCAHDKKDSFIHEQNLLIHEHQTVLMMGCGHAGIVNILEEAGPFDVCIGGYHLMNPVTKQTVSANFLNEVAKTLGKYKHARFYTCHCTGQTAFTYLAGKLPNLFYLSCGQELIL